jgi:hypothetical protein
MFARDDVHRGRRWPLLWVFLPLILGALLVTGLGILARASQGFPNVELADEIRQASNAGDPMLAEVTDFEWDRVCLFGPDTPRDEVDARLGLEWGVVGGDTSPDRRVLLVFVSDERVVSHLYLRRGVLDPPADGGDCRAPEDESTRL